MWFECKIRYRKIDQNGKEKVANELYLLDALSFTEAEARITKEMEAYITGEFSVTNIKVANYSELIPSEDGDRWFKSKVAFVSVDEEKGVEKKINSSMLVHALNVKDAYEKLEVYLADTISEYEIPAITESPIMDVFAIHEEEELEDKIISEEDEDKDINEEA